MHRRCFPTFARLTFSAALLTGAAGCFGTPAEVRMREQLDDAQARIAQLENTVAERENSLRGVQAQLAAARGLSDEDLTRIYYPDRIEIDALSGGADYDGRPGDDGVTVYVRPIDRDGDAIKVAGDITVQLFDLANPPGKTLVGEYRVPVAEAGKLWHGKFLASHYTIKCPWSGSPPEHDELTIRATFVDYLTKRVLSAQSVGKVKLAGP